MVSFFLPSMVAQARTVVLVDGADARARVIAATLAAGGISVLQRATRQELIGALEDEDVDAVVLGGNLPDADCLELIAALTAKWPDVPVIVADETVAPAALNAGAVDYLRTPLESQETLFVVNKAITQNQPVAQRPPSARNQPGDLEPSSPAMQRAFDTVRRVASGVATVLIRGESGVGKELIARRIHQLSARGGRPFVKVHCAALPEQILESELFGYEKGAFTGATARKPGRIDLAEGGTLFLDEIGDISAATQVKLLRILQDREFERLGGTRTLKADVRFVAATHRNLERMIKRGEFREDLYYRLSVVQVDVPALRDRPEDLDQLIAFFASSFAVANAKSVTFSADAVDLLKQQRWPGNVRQLQNFIERAVVLTDSAVIDAAELRPELERITGALSAADVPSEVSVIELGAAVRRAEYHAIQKALRKSGGDRTVAARILGVSRRTLFYKLREHQLNPTR